MSDAAARRLKLRTAATAAIVSALFSAIKLALATWTGSLAVLASCVDSLVDTAASTLNYFSVRHAERPPDEDHSYGHGKAESVAGLFQSVFLLLCASAVVVLAIRRWSEGQGPERIDEAIGVMILAAGTSALLAWRLKAVGVATDSVALRADSVHYATDLWTNLGAIVALFLVRQTGLVSFDPLVSVLISLWLIRAGGKVLRESLDGLMDRELGDDVKAQIIEVLKGFAPDVIDHHDLRTRSSGSRKFVQLHLVIRTGLSFERAHDITERAIDAIREVVPRSEVTIHADPALDAGDSARRVGSDL